MHSCWLACNHLIGTSTPVYSPSTLVVQLVSACVPWPPSCELQWLDAHMTMTSVSHVSAHSTCLTFWRWRCSCWLRAFLARASASFCTLASGTAALMLRLAKACLAAGNDLALASEPPLNAGEWTSCVPVSCSADCTSMMLGHPVRRYAMGWPLKTECLLMGFAQTLRAHPLKPE